MNKKHKSIIKYSLILLTSAITVSLLLLTVSDSFVIYAHSMINKDLFSFQIITYLLLTLILFAGIISSLFLKIKLNKKIGLLIIFVACIFLLHKIPSIASIFDIDYCVENGICKERMF